MKDNGKYDRLGKILVLLIVVVILFYSTPLVKIIVEGKFSLIYRLCDKPVTFLNYNIFYVW